MGYNMKHGNSGVKFKSLGSSPAKQDDKFLEEQKEEAVKTTDYLHKTPNPTVASDIAFCGVVYKNEIYDFRGRQKL